MRRRRIYRWEDSAVRTSLMEVEWNIDKVVSMLVGKAEEVVRSMQE